LFSFGGLGQRLGPAAWAISFFFKIRLGKFFVWDKWSACLSFTIWAISFFLRFSSASFLFGVNGVLVFLLRLGPFLFFL